MGSTPTGFKPKPVVLSVYFKSLIDLFFKILPIKESGEDSLVTYMTDLRDDLIGCDALIDLAENEPLVLQLISSLEYLIQNPDCEVIVVRRKVFRSISILNKLRAKYASSSEV